MSENCLLGSYWEIFEDIEWPVTKKPVKLVWFFCFLVSTRFDIRLWRSSPSDTSRQAIFGIVANKRGSCKRGRMNDGWKGPRKSKMRFSSQVQITSPHLWSPLLPTSTAVQVVSAVCLCGLILPMLTEQSTAYWGLSSGACLPGVYFCWCSFPCIPACFYCFHTCPTCQRREKRTEQLRVLEDFVPDAFPSTSISCWSLGQRLELQWSRFTTVGCLQTYVIMSSSRHWLAIAVSASRVHTA